MLMAIQIALDITVRCTPRLEIVFGVVQCKANRDYCHQQAKILTMRCFEARSLPCDFTKVDHIKNIDSCFLLKSFNLLQQPDGIKLVKVGNCSYKNLSFEYNLTKYLE